MTDDAVYLRIGSEYWPVTRKDRFLGSRVITGKNNEPLRSQRHVQLVELTIGDTLIPGPFSRSYQEIAWFLRSSLRLNPVDISRIIEEVDTGSRGHAQLSWKDEHSICFTVCTLNKIDHLTDYIE